MGSFVNRYWVRIVVSLLSLFVIGVNIYFVVDFVLENLHGVGAYVGLAVVGFFYSCFLVSF